jgi:hypothetical protein
VSSGRSIKNEHSFLLIGVVVSNPPVPSSVRPPHSPWRRAIAVGGALALLVAVIVMAFSWPSVTSDPKDVPIAVSGPDAAVSSFRTALHDKAGDVFAVRTVADRAAAVRAIERRSDYGAVILGSSPEVLTASAASTVVSQQLTALAPVLQAQLQQAIAAQLPPGATAPAVTVTVTDVVPLASTDPRGTGLIAAAFPLVLGGMIGGIALTMLLVGALRRLIGLAVYGVVAGLVVAAILQGWFGVLQGSYLLNAGVFALALVAIGAPIVGFAALVGPRGIAIGPVLFLLIGNPISSASTPVEFLAAPWGAIGQWFPPGAGATLVRDASYFPDADTSFPWLVLACWAAAGVVLGLLGHFRQTGGATTGSIEEAEEAEQHHGQHEAHVAVDHGESAPKHREPEDARATS